MDDWYRLKRSNFEGSTLGRRILKKHKNIVQALQELFPERTWHPWKFNQVPRSFWKSVDNQREYIEWLYNELKYQNMDDWYKLTGKDMAYGRSLLDKYHGSPYIMLKTLYPDFDWKSNRFPKAPRNHWSNIDNVVNEIKSLEKKLHINDPLDWNRVSVKQLSLFKGLGLYSKFGCLANLLSFAYPDIKWDSEMINNRVKKASQRWLLIKLKEIFPNQTILEDYKHSVARDTQPSSMTVELESNTEPSFTSTENRSSSDSGRGRSIANYFEIDIFIPELNIGFEYQGEHHFHDLHSAYGPASTVHLYKTRDDLKRKLCRELGIVLIHIPYWWKGDVTSLLEYFPLSLREKISHQKLEV
eukprot:TRINITY_DN6048_c0_g1_i1.p1 TRINITY_DN6048_c0_g1~~TRINITY_DN6048_c0_g1_i1.p1  ORF type:complete len:420 (-),score=48.57 TRINITY_DN6048_c0_g1_i1:135-1205(-)